MCIYIVHDKDWTQSRAFFIYLFIYYNLLTIRLNDIKFEHISWPTAACGAARGVNKATKQQKNLCVLSVETVAID